MQVDLAGRTALLVGAAGAVAEAVAAALAENGALVRGASVEEALGTPDMLGETDLFVPVLELRPELPAGGIPVSRLAEAYATARGSGRLVLVSSALGLLAMRRYPDASVAMAAAATEIRLLAMRLSPKILVNGVGAGAIEGKTAGEFVSGSPAMLSHVPSGEAGTLSDIANAVLFLCDPLNTYMTGQILVVDGGWMAGYGRNF